MYSRSVSSSYPLPRPLLLSRPLFLLLVAFSPCLASDGLARVRGLEQARIETIARAAKSVVCILGPDQAGGGSGVIITPDGYGVTNFHVIMGMIQTRRGQAGLADGKTYPLELLGIDPTGDLAMFRLTGRDRFEPAPLGDSDAVRVGDPVVALGNPFMLAEDYTPTATFGIVSGVQRYQFGADARSLVYTDCLQIDASINPGNSGGPLFDLQGRLIGINGRASFKRDDPLRQRVNVGVAYAISINQVKLFIPALKEGWMVEHGTLGATVGDTREGVRFDKVLPNSPAERIGIEVGDELAAFDGRPIHSANAFANVLGIFPAGWPVTVTFRRGDREFCRKVALEALPLPEEVPWPKADPAWIQSVAEGLVATTLPYDVAALVSQPSSAGAPAPSSHVTHEPTAPIADVLPAVVKIYGGRIGGQQGYATGVVVSADGEIVTPLSLLLEASDLRIVASDGSLHRAEVVHRDAYRQLALLELAGPRSLAVSRMQPLAMDESLQPSTGDTVYAVGNPFKIADGDERCSVAQGILSGRIQLDARQPGGGRPVAYRGEVLIIDTIASNPGSPGSALLDGRGRWIGLVGEVVESRLTNTLINYAYPLHEVAAFLAEARVASTAPANVSDSERKPGYHGIKLSRIGYRQKLPFVESVVAGSPAARAGVKVADLIVSANGRSIPRSRAFEELCQQLPSGEELSIVLKRGDELVTVRFKLEEASE